MFRKLIIISAFLFLIFAFFIGKEYQTYLAEEKQQNKEEQAIVQGMVYELFPSDVLARVTDIVPHSDGVGEYLATVEQMDDTGTTWHWEYDPEDTFDEDGIFIDREEFFLTLIHEFAHILTLNETQVRHIQDEEIVCKETESLIDEGCALETSYIHQFASTFWTEEQMLAAYNTETIEDVEELAEQLYNEDPDAFIGEYAATNVSEDIADSFAIFVIDDAPNEDDAYVYEEKILFFYAYPELVDMRTNIRTAIDDIRESIPQ